ncbi:tail fiber domain-containing protein [Candidatus Nomurabacteria bacterium]|nr:MAG: tail fiber domain-containing protein [Candidatus Nomurabacteria bacterium]
MYRFKIFKKNILRENRLLVIALLFLFVFSITIRAFATYPATPFAPSDQENDPSCSPGDANCYVTPMAIGETVGTGTLGSVLFLGTAGILAEDNTNFFWDDTNNRLGLGTASPDTILDITGSGGGALFTFNTGGTNKTAQINFVDASTSKAVLGWDGPNARFELDTDESIYLGDMATEDYYFSIERGSFMLTGGQTSVYNSTGADLVVSGDSDGVSVSPGINTFEMAIYSSAAGIMPLWINLATSQTANAITVTDNGGSTLTAITAGGLVQATSGSTTTPGFGFVGDTDNGLYRATTNEIGLVTASTERLRIDAAGEIGIGDTTPDYLLDVENTGVDTNIFALTDSDGACLHNPEAGTETVTCSSDERLKENIVNADPLLPYFREFNIREYDVRASGDHMVGVVAQEVQEIYPDLVKMGGNGFYTVEIPSTWQVIKAIQELDISIQSISSLSLENERSLASIMIDWFSDAANGIQTFFAREIHTNVLCVGEVCVTEEEFLNIVNKNNESVGNEVSSDQNINSEDIPSEEDSITPLEEVVIPNEEPPVESEPTIVPDEETTPEIPDLEEEPLILE